MFNLCCQFMSTNNIEQNGRQPPLPNQPTPPSDPRPGYESEQQKPICRKYVWGTCTKNTLCKFRHELVFEEMKKILKFCHDYQNKQGCTRLDCSYLHTTSEEENLFLSTGQLPQVLQARYAAMSETNSCMPNFEGIPQMVMFVTPPPPPPPPAPLMTAVAAAPPPPPPVQPAPFRPVQQPPPPPPPPPTIPPAASAVQAPNVFTAPPPQYPPNQPPPLFDPSRPPPPFQPKENLKRRRDEIEAGSSKIAKLEEPKSDAPCDSCIQREIRIELFKEQMGKLEQEEEYQSLIYKKKLEEFESGKEVLRSLVSSELYRILEEHIEGGPQVQDILAQFTQSPFLLGTSTVPKQFLLQLLEYVFNNSKHLMESPVSPSLMQTLTTLSRIQNPINHSSSDRVQTVLDMLRNSNAADRNKSVESRSIEPLNIQENRAGFSNNNGISRFSNGQKLESSGSVPNPNASRCPCPPISTARTYTAGPGSGALTSSGNRPQAPSTGNYPSYHPTVPPPPANRPYYGSPSNGTRTGAGSTAQIPVRSAAVTASTISQSYQYMMGRFPHPSHYYPPFQ